MKILSYIASLLLAFTLTSVANGQTFYDNTGPTAFRGAFLSSDEIADDTPFSGTQHVASFTFAYTNSNSGPVNATVRFYAVNPNTGSVGSLVATVPANNLAPTATAQIVTVNLDPSLQFDWIATPGIYRSQSTLGGFVSFQFSAPDHTAGWLEASGASIDGFYDLTTGQFITFQGDTSASFYLQLSGSTVATTVTTVSLNPQTVKGGLSSQATVTVTSPAPAGGLVVRLFSSKPRIAAVPASVTIPAGASSVTVLVRTRAVTNRNFATISATLNGVTKGASLFVNP
jgi:hypothetical protein